jgi:short subunit fatty acids transporter
MCGIDFVVLDPFWDVGRWDLLQMGGRMTLFLILGISNAYEVIVKN